ncbi:MAG: glutamate-5-semialdehyde dehydrogenase [Planctomycetaceae bacterium]|nr:glutamate-5-semialdehyde dehydrogenase [Planctomycetaceae bacterium]
MTDVAAYAAQVARAAKDASRRLAVASGQQKDQWLCRAAELIRARGGEVLAANQRDLEAAPGYGLSTAAIDRLRLSIARLESVASALEEIARLPNPVGEIIDGSVRPNGLEVSRVRVPLGVVFFIYESRPNVTADAAAICVKSGNAVILRGGKEALHSNRALHTLLALALDEVGLPAAAVQLVETTDRSAVGHFLRMNEYIDVTIPRGGKSLIERVMAEATMPVIKHYDGICHVYVDRAADLEMARAIVVNSKCQRPGVCNAAESLLVHAAIAERFLPDMARELKARGVELRCCERSRRLMPGSRAATDDDYRTEFLDLILSVRVVDDLEQALEHIDSYGSHHTDAIVTNDLQAAQQFAAIVDSAAVMVNASTRFNDGGAFGLGAEIGISTDKFHARGPCGLRELTSYKYVARGSGQVRE